MIIEIKNIPEGHKIKNISVDVTFEEDSVTVTPIIKKESKQIIDEPKIPESLTEMELPNSEAPEITLEGRDKKEIPDEMKNMEF